MAKTMKPVSLAVCFAVSSGVACAQPPSQNRPQPFNGKLWIVSNAGLTAQSPPPTATPDVTFVTKHVSFFSSAPDSYFPHIAKENNFVAAFLRGDNKISSVAYSGLVNPVINGVVGPDTPTVASNARGCGTYGVYMELTGNLALKHNQFMIVAADDGAQLMIDNVVQSGVAWGLFYTGYTYSGSTGYHNVDLAFANGCGAGYLSFSRAM